MKVRKKYFYICEDCGEVIPLSEKHLFDRKTPHCKICNAKLTSRALAANRSNNYHIKSIESRRIQRDSLYYGLYNLGLDDYLNSNAINFIEWPSLVANYINWPHFRIYIETDTKLESWRNINLVKYLE